MESLFSLTFIGINLFFVVSKASDSITPSQSISDGRTLVSSGGAFELGFFSPGSSRNRYLGIWYKNVPVKTVVWVANRGNPIIDSSGLLMLNATGNLLLLGNQNRSVVWSSPNSTTAAQSPLVQLLDSGNLVLRDGAEANTGIYLWQSFDYPSDTLLPGMKLGWELKTGLDRRITSWKSPDDPSPGDFTWGIELQNNSEGFLLQGSKKLYRSGMWNGLAFSGAPELRSNPVFEFTFVSNQDELYYIYYLKNPSTISRIVMNQTTYHRERYTWSEAEKTWILYASVPRDHCDEYGLCGPYGYCIISQSPVCQCLEKFQPRSPSKWNSMDWSQGCVRNKPLDCPKGDGFVKYTGLKLPDATHSILMREMSLKDCRASCLKNCSCTAYTTADIRGAGSGCAMWFDDLVDIRQIASGGQKLFIRMSASEADAKGNSKVRLAVIIVCAVGAVAGMVIVGYYIKRRRTKIEETARQNMGSGHNNGQQTEDMELPMFDLAVITTATNNFSNNNRLGEGGFGPVYKGTLVDGKEIAVKRLSTSSGQGLNEFKNEVRLIAKLQHRNLVRLLGCCIQEDEKMLIYEYMPNKSLDSFLFDQTRAKLIDWNKRFNIICGIARGLLYLHQDSRLRIIHRDLKASNVLLDDELNPKISDFGMARTFGGDQTEGNTNRVVGTYGYMAPEYAIDGLFSVKSDVFSFGILMLEIIKGQKNRGFYNPNHSLNLVGHAWSLWKEGRPLELAEEFLVASCNPSEVIRCIHISLLCVQQHPEDRPSMASVVLMLASDCELPQPKQPGFFADRMKYEGEFSSSKIESSSTNEITVTLLEAR